MIKHLVTAAAVAACASSALATTTVGNATLLDTATVVNGTVSPTTFLTYVSGGNGATGYATGSTYGSSGLTPAQAMAAADHEWLQFDGPIIMNSTIALRSVIAVPAIDHGWVAGNLGAEFFEPFEFRIFPDRQLRRRQDHQGLD